MASLMTSLPIWLIFLITFVMGLLAAHLGAWIIRRREQKGTKEKEVGGTVVGAMLGLLAFMLGFSFSSTTSRYADRKALVIKQAQALTMCYMRTDLIPEKQKQESRKILRESVNMLVSTSNPSQIEDNIVKIEALNSQLWNVAASLQKDSIDSELRSLYISSVNEVIQVYTERKTVALFFRVNGTIWSVLLLLYILGMMVVGGEAASSRTRRIQNVPIMCAAFALVVALIAEVDSSSIRPGRFTANKQPLIDAQAIINK